MQRSFLVSWRNLTRYKKRFFFTLIAIVLGVVVMTGMLIAKETTASSLEYYERLYAGSADYWIQTNDFSFGEDELAWLDEHDVITKGNASLIKQGFVELTGVNPAQSSVRLTGVSSFDNDLFELPEKEGDVSEEGLIITENAADLWDKEIGDSVTFTDMGSMEVTAIVHEGSMLSSPETMEQANTQHSRVMIPLDVLQEWTGMEGKITDYRFEAEEGLASDKLLASFQSELSSSDAFVQPVVIDDRQNNDVEGLYWTFDIIAILSVFISAFIAFNMIYANIMERRREFAIMKSLGYTTGDIYRLVLQEIGLLSFIGTAIALPIGIWFGDLFQELLMSTIATQNITYELELTFPLIVSAIVGILFPFIAAIFPVYQAGNTPVMKAMADNAVHKYVSRRSNSIRIIAGILCTGIGMIDNVWAFLFLFIGLVLLYPFFMRAIQVMIGPLFKVNYAGKQAMRAVQQFESRNANTSAMLAIGVTLTLFMSAALESVPDGMESEIRSTYGGDIHAVKETPWQETELEAIQEMKGTAGASLFADIPNVTWQTKQRDEREFSIMSFSGDSEDAEIFQVTEEVAESEQFPNLYLGERALAEWGGEVGDILTLNTPAGATEFHVKGTVQTSHYTGYAAFVEASVLGQVLNWPQQFHVAIDTDDEESLPLVYDQLWESYGDELSDVSSATQDVERSNSALTGMNELMQGLLLLVIVLSAIGISNTLFMNTLERIKEIGTMRAIGFTKGQVRLMIIAEGLIIGVAGVIVGIAYGILVIYLNAQSEQAQEWLSFAVPWVSLFLAIAGGILFTLFASWLPSITASRVPVKEAITYE
ncbi:FtsX-like permease family protein [Virgibacillus sp. NKC19-3]|uniref:ABC transporter permease n=1 Tax=Virgibacillus saliphilus TaxID=2831674 RepID=UPI001C9B12E9|nr:FtsX-like permease family protein [Virgibacillus sp. NKC19-3]MBY7145013.1 FtsX-like permease family protein [Virgibacillus sp. NKC19-3]